MRTDTAMMIAGVVFIAVGLSVGFGVGQIVTDEATYLKWRAAYIAGFGFPLGAGIGLVIGWFATRYQIGEIDE